MIRELGLERRKTARSLSAVNIKMNQAQPLYERKWKCWPPVHKLWDRSCRLSSCAMKVNCVVERLREERLVNFRRVLVDY